MIKDTEEPMKNLSQQQKIEAEQLFSRALQSAKANDYVTAVQYYKQAAQYGHPGAQNNLGNQYKNGRGVDKNPQEAVRLFTLSAKQGSVFGMRNLASCYMDGIGVEADFDLAVDWLETAAEQKDNLACAMLAKAYDNWNHKDEEKKIFWHKKAAEYGNADSMFVLGEYYDKKGDNQDLSLASTYYDDAAKNGTPEMKLKVAKAFDMPSYSEGTALNLEKAKYWYNEILTCDNDKIALDAAKGLDEMIGSGGAIRRPALDIDKAYMTYRALAMKGNKSAYSLAAYCCEVGKGTKPNIDFAIIFYEKAGEFDKVAWCKRKKDGNLLYKPYIERVENEMPDRIRNPYSHGKECYRGINISDIDFKFAEYDGTYYFIIGKYGEYEKGIYLCSSDNEGKNLKIVAEIAEDYDHANIHVNCTGIYLYYLVNKDEQVELHVLYVDFEGKQLAENRVSSRDEEKHGVMISNIYIYGTDLFYIYTYVFSQDGVDDEKSCIKCMHIDTGIDEILYDKASCYDRLYASENNIIFKARYYNGEYAYLSAEGWMIKDISTGKVECISNPYCNPENLVDNPLVYIPESSEYNEKCDFDRNIVYFDLSREIFWTERVELEGEDSAHLHQVKYWEPRELWGNRDETISEMPIWKITKESSFSGREYFDGRIHYWDEGYYIFKSSSKDGKIYDWTEYRDGHGVCDKFKIVGEYMFLNIAAYDEEQYPLTVEVSSPIRKSWFNMSIPNSVIEEYKAMNSPNDSIKQDIESTLEMPDETKENVSDIESTFESTDEEGTGTKVETKKEENLSGKELNMRLCDLRLNAERFVGVRDELLSFRKALPEKWDYNAFVGILLSVKGPKHGDMACSNFAIGQGDNNKSTEKRLEFLGLKDLYEEYKGKKYNYAVTVSEVEDEIIEIAPSLSEIRHFFDKTVLEKMCDSSFDLILDDSTIASAEKDDNCEEATDHDLFVVKTISETDVKYNICTFGAKFHVGFGVPVRIKINGNNYDFRMHKTAKGRIDGMKKLFADNAIKLGTVLNASYDAETHEINLEIQ